ncbi:hypothetical protein ACOMHN_027465 [Nucella lapillus]
MCNLEGHFARCCKTKKKRPKSGKLHTITEDAETRDSDSDDSVFVIRARASPRSSSNTITVQCGGIDVDFTIDSGATCNIIGLDLWKQLKKKGVNYTSKETTEKKLYVYGSDTPLRLKGKFRTELSVGERKITTDILVLDGEGDALLGLDTAKALDLLRVGRPPEEAVHSINTDYTKAHPQLFEGLGKLKGHKVHLHVRDDAHPVAQPPRRIPFSLRTKVENKIAELEAAEIIEKVDGPTPWVSPIVVVPKPNGDIRLCVDMRRANEAVE